jgi:hypothetical protein
MAHPIIGITGHARSGKDTFASHLIERHGYTKVAFADTLREVLMETDPTVDWCVDDDGEVMPFTLSEVMACNTYEFAKDNIPDVRRLLQNLGQALRDLVDPDIWVKAAIRRIEKINGPVVVTDVRYPNEADAIHALGGEVVRVTRPGFNGVNNHESEHAMDDYDVDMVVLNTGTVDELHLNAEAVAQWATMR